MSFWDDINPIKQAERFISAKDGGEAARAIMDPIARNVSGWKQGDAAIPPPAFSEEDIAKYQYDQDKRALIDKQMANNKQFRSNLAGYERDLYSQIEGDAKAAIADKQREIKRQANRRGLLYSGLRQGDEARTAAEISSKAASQKAKVAPELNNLAELMEQQTAKLSQANYQDDLAIATQVYDRALDTAKSRMAALGDIGEAVGGVVGEYFGSRDADSDRYEMQKRLYSKGLNPDGTID
jgi:hypothetical protein